MAIVVKYNGYTLPNIYGTYTFTQSYENITFRCNFLINENSSSGLISEEKQAIEKIREPFEKLEVDFNGSGEYDLVHDDNTALNPSASISKINDVKSTETSRAYQFEYKAMLEADKSGFDFRQSSSFEVTSDETTRRNVSFELVYTASSSPKRTAFDNFELFAEPYCLGVLAIFGGAFEKKGRKTRVDDQDKIAKGNFFYQEILADELDGIPDDPRLVGVETNFSVNLGQTRGLAITTPYEQCLVHKVDVSFSAKIDFSQISNLTEIEEIYRNSVRPFLVQRAFIVLGLQNYNPGDFFITEMENFAVNPNTPAIQGKMSFTTMESENCIITFAEKVNEDEDAGVLLKKMWSGKANDYAAYKMGKTESITRSVSIVALGEAPVIAPVLTEFGGVSLVYHNRKTVRSKREIGLGTNPFATELIAPEVHHLDYTEHYTKVASISNGVSLG